MLRHLEARKRATQLLQMLAVAYPPPVDLDRIAQALGFNIIPYDFPDSTAGITYIDTGVKAIGINKNHPSVRRRFSLAHEIGHYLLGHEAYDDGGTHVDEERPSYLDPQVRQEQEANAFAAELLMPSDWLRRDAARFGLDGKVLATRYNVSEQAMWIQLLDLQLT